MFEFLSEKLWFWFAVAWCWMIVLGGCFFIAMKFSLRKRIERFILVVPGILGVLSWVTFIISVLCRAWGE